AASSARSGSGWTTGRSCAGSGAGADRPRSRVNQQGVRVGVEGDRAVGHHHGRMRVPAVLAPLGRVAGGAVAGDRVVADRAAADIEVAVVAFAELAVPAVVDELHGDLVVGVRIEVPGERDILPLPIGVDGLHALRSADLLAVDEDLELRVARIVVAGDVQ